MSTSSDLMDSTRLEQLFRERRGAAVGVAVRAGTAPEVAEDAVSDVFLALLTRGDREISNPQAYLHRAVRNRLSDGHRRAVRHQELSPLLARDADGWFQDEQVVDRSVLLEALRRLPTRQRQAVTLRYLRDLDQREAAEAMGVSVGAVKSYTSRGLDTLRRVMAA